MAASRPVVIACAPNGAYKQRADHPALPLSLTEIVATAIAVHRAGASMLHLHIREADGTHSLNPTLYQRTLDAIQTALNDKLLLQITSEAGGKFTADEQIASVMAVKPEAVSVALRELIHDKTDHPRAQAFFNWLAEQQILPQYILYSPADFLLYQQLLRQAIMPPHPHSVLLVLGSYHRAQPSSSDDLTAFLPFLPLPPPSSAPTSAPSLRGEQPKLAWMVCAFGAAEQACLLHAAQLGGQVRVGFENNLLASNGTLAVSNAAQINSLKAALLEQGARIASAHQARILLSGGSEVAA